MGLINIFNNNIRKAHVLNRDLKAKWATSSETYLIAYLASAT